MYTEQGSENSASHHHTFDEIMQAKALEKAKMLETKAEKTLSPIKKKALIKQASSYHEAIGELQDMTKAEAVDWIQRNTGGHKGAEMSGAGEYKGNVWSRQTACEVLSSWPEIFSTVAGIIADKTDS
jgi:hypothetical protein